MATKALKAPGSTIEYICLTRGQAKKNLWRALKTFNDDFELNLKFHETNLTATFPNGSLIEFMGGETRQECEKFRGQSFDLVVIDECKSFSPEVLEELIEEILDPALSDRFGTIALIGTPGNVLNGPFYEATSHYVPSEQVERRTQLPRPYGERELFKANKWRWNWSFHSWHTRHNVAMPHIWELALESKENRGIPDTDPSWQREWLGLWCPSDSLTVYTFCSEINVYSGKLPAEHEWQYILGIDLGYNDSTAIVVAAFSDTDPNMYQVYEWKEPGLTVDRIEKQVRKVMRKFPELNAMIADTGGLGKTIIESLREHGLAFEAAVKTDKLDHITMVNSDLQAGRIKLLPDSHLAAEMKLLQWKDKTYKKENKGTDNHCCDAFLYLIRHAYHHFWEATIPLAAEGTPEYLRNFDELELESMMAQYENGQVKNTLDAVSEDFTLDGEQKDKLWN